MKKLEQLQKVVIANKITQLLNREEIATREKITITVETKSDGTIKTLELKKGEE